MSRENLKVIITVGVIIVVFIAGYLFSCNFLRKPLNDNEFKQCEQVARDVYVQKENVIVEAPEGFCVYITATTITVGYENKLRRGQIIAKLQNGKLVMTQDMEIDDAIASGIIGGILSLFILLIVWQTVKSLYRKRQKK